MPTTPRANHVPSSPKGKKPNWQQRFEALKNLPPFLRLVWETQRSWATAIVCLRIIRALTPLGLLWVGKLIVDGVVAAIASHQASQTVPWLHLGMLVGIELGIAIINEAAARAGSLCESRLGDRFGNVMSVRLMEHAAKLDLEQFEDPEFYNHLERARRQSTNCIGLIVIILGMAQGLITLASLTGALVIYVPWLLIPLILTVLPSFIGETHFATLGYSLLFRWTPQRRQLDYLRNVGTNNQTAKEIKLFDLSGWLVGRYTALAEEFDMANAKLAARQCLTAWLLAVLSTLGYYGAYVWIIVLTIRGYNSPVGLFTLGVFTFLAASFRQSRDRIQGILLSTAQLYEQSLYLGDLFTFFEMKPKIISKPNARAIPNPIVRGFEFRDVGFRYQGSEKWATRHLSFTLGVGERIALVGENGAGKTTLVKLLTRLYDPNEGVILLDGVDLREYDLASLNQTIGVIFQDFVRYDFLLRENIGVGEIGAMDDLSLITSSAEQSLASEVAGRIKNGYDQMLGHRFDNGTELSGGEWQKVALARAYMRTAGLLILDEPTAALDARAESLLFGRFAELAKGKMVILISHRFSTTRTANRILVLDQGQIIEHGTHQELLAKRGKYAELFELQSAGYK